MGTSIAPSRVVVTTTPAVVGGVVWEEQEISDDFRQIPKCPIYLYAQYINVFPPEMAINQPDPNLRLDPEEGWKLLYPFTEPGVRKLQVNTSVNLARMAKSDSIVEMIQIHAYLKDVPDLGRRDYRRYPPRYGDGGIASTFHVITRLITTAPSLLPVVDSSGLSALDAVPERRMLFEDERMTEERARPGIIRESFGTEDVAASIESSFIRPLGSLGSTSATVNVTSHSAVVSSGTTGVLVYGGGPAAPSRPDTGSV